MEIVSGATALESENEGSLVKIHYVGYSNAHDEWRRRDDIIHFDSPCNLPGEFCLNNELALRIKASLSGGRRSNPAVKIDMSFDKSVYCRGLKEARYHKCMKRGIEYYTIQSYKDLDGLFGANWHYRGLNATGDFCYVIENTVEFYLYKKRPLVQYISDTSGNPVKMSVSRGYSLVFRFVRGDGTRLEFGTLHSVFDIN